MKIVFLHGLGQTAKDWQTVVELCAAADADCPELFSLANGNFTYDELLSGLEDRYTNESEPFVLCGLSLGAVLALDYSIRHPDKVSSLILIGAQYKVPTRLIDFQNIIFRLMPGKMFDSTGLSKADTIKLSHSMRALDFSRSLDKITCPVTIICGEKDSANLKASRELKALLPQSRLIIVPGAGHEVNKCAPDAISAVINNL